MEPMKALLIITILFSNKIFAAEKPAAKPNVDGVVIINDSIQKLMDIPGVNPLYETCKKDNTGTQKSDMERTQIVMQCLWDKLNDKPEIKKKVQEAYAAEQTADIKKPTDVSRAPASVEKSDVVTKKTIINTGTADDPAVVALSKFYGDKLDAVLDPNKALTKDEIKKNTILAVDHSKFIELYKSELGKTIINAFTSYCLDTKPETCKCTGLVGVDDCKCTIDPNTMADDQKSNLKDLKNSSLDSNSAAGKKWQSCITAVTKNCKQTNLKSQEDETSKRACLIVDYVGAARKNLLVADEQIKFYTELGKEKSVQLVQNTKVIDAEKSSSDALLSVTSKDITTSMTPVVKQSNAEMDACYKDGAIVNANACKKYLSTDKDANDAAIAELGIREMAQEGILKDSLDKSPDGVRNYLKEEGFTPDQIKAMTVDDKTIQNTKDEIIARYQSQKAAIIAEMAKKIDSKTSAQDGKIDAKKDLPKIIEISNELNSRTTDLANLVQFNNIVASYLTVEVTDGGKKENTRNTASLYSEVKDMSAEDAKIYKKKLEEANLPETKTISKNISTGAKLEVDTINSNFLNYSTTPKKAEDDKKN
jgi:hypothetical protein